MGKKKEIQKVVQAYYADIARNNTACCTPANRLYPPDLLQGLPGDIASFTAGSGDPVSPADLQPGETVLDLGSGGGLDCFLAARLVGKAGRVIGVDMTPEMLARASRDAERLGLEQVSFREGTLEALPVDDESVDVVVSNCVINLSVDKALVFREILRVLKPGGRISISDMVANHAVPPEGAADMGAWCACSTGALPLGEYRFLLESAGFSQIEFSPGSDLVARVLKMDSINNLDMASAEGTPAVIKSWEALEDMDFRSFLIRAVKPV